MKRLSVPAKVTELVTFVVVSTTLMSWIEHHYLDMSVSDITRHRLANAALNVAALLGAGRIKQLTHHVISLPYTLGIRDHLTAIQNRRDSVGEAIRTAAAIAELTAIQAMLYWPFALALGVSREVIMFVALPEIGLGSTALWMYHRSFEDLYHRLYRPALIGLRRVWKRAEQVQELLAKRG